MSLYMIAVFLDRIVMPFSRSSSFESIIKVPTASFLRKMLDCLSIPSTNVVLPWSTWAIIATLRISSRARLGEAPSVRSIICIFLCSVLFPAASVAFMVFASSAESTRSAQLRDGQMARMRAKAGAAPRPRTASAVIGGSGAIAPVERVSTLPPPVAYLSPMPTRSQSIVYHAQRIRGEQAADGPAKRCHVLR